MQTKTKQSSRHVEAVLAALDILDCFLRKPALSLKQIMDMTGLTRNRVMRLTGSLEAQGYLNLDLSPAKITLGPKCLRLGKVFESSFNLVLISRPILHKLAQETGESASLYMRDGLQRVVIAREEGSQVIRYSVNVGQRMPLHAGAAGKVILAFGPKEIKKQILEDGNLAGLTEHTITDKKKLETEISKILSQGYAISLGENFSDVASIAAPVFGHQRDFTGGAISIAGPLSRFKSDLIEEKKKKLVSAAKQISYLLGDDREKTS